MSKPFSNLINKDKDKDKDTSLSNNISFTQISEKSNPLIISGFLISLTSIFLLLFTIKNKFG